MKCLVFLLLVCAALSILWPYSRYYCDNLALELHCAPRMTQTLAIFSAASGIGMEWSSYRYPADSPARPPNLTCAHGRLGGAYTYELLPRCNRAGFLAEYYTDQWLTNADTSLGIPSPAT